MTNNIADDLDRNDLQSQIQKAINRAILYYRSERFWFNETITSLTLVANQESYGVNDGWPSNMLKLDTANLIRNPTDKYLLIPKDYAWLVMVNPNTSVGPPDCYAIYEEQIFMYPIPDRSYSVTLSYLKSYDALVDAEDENDFTSNAEDLIEARAEWWLYSRVIRDNDAAQQCKADELDALYALRRMSKNYIGSGELRYRD